MEAQQTYNVPLFCAPIVVFPGCLQPINIHELWAERLVHFVLNKIPKQRIFALLYTPSAADAIPTTDGDEENRVGVLLRVINAYYPDKPGGRFIVLVKAVHRVEVKSRHEHPILNFPMANVVKYLDYEEEELREQQQRRESADPAVMKQLPALVDDDNVETEEERKKGKDKGKEREKERIARDDDAPVPRNEKEQEESMRDARSTLDAFVQRFRFNSMWKVIKQRLSQDDPPFDQPELLGYWMAATLPPAAWTRGDPDKVRMLRERRWEARLKQAVALFKKYPPVRNAFAVSSDAALMWDRDSSFSLSSVPTDEPDASLAPSRLAPLKEKCVEFICTNDRWKSPLIAEMLPALPIEVIERILLYLHRTERLTLEALEYFRTFPVETLFLSNIRAIEDSWLEVLKGYTSLTYLDLSHSYRITDAGLAECLSCMPQLRSLFVDRCKRITDAGLAPLATHCPGLRRLDVGGTLITYYTLAALTSLEDLQDVVVSGTRFPDQAMYPLIKRTKDGEDEGQQAPTLRPLRRFEAAKTLLRDEGAALLGGLSASLHTLNLSFNPGISDWSFLGGLTSLTHLDLSLNVGFTDESAAAVGKLTSLTLLNLSKTELTDAGVSELLTLTQLRSLDVGKTAITHRTLGPGLSELSGLTSLSLPYSDVGSKLSRYLPALVHLTSFKATGCPRFGNKGMLELAKGRYPSLTSLEVGSDQLTDSGLVHIGELSVLQHFNLWNTKVTNQGADLVQQLTGLVLDDLMNTSKGTYLFVRK